MVDDGKRDAVNGTSRLFAERKQRVCWRTRLGVAIQSRTGVQLIPERGESESRRPIRCTCDPRHDRPAKSWVVQTSATRLSRNARGHSNSMDDSVTYTVSDVIVVATEPFARTNRTWGTPTNQPTRQSPKRDVKPPILTQRARTRGAGYRFGPASRRFIRKLI